MVFLSFTSFFISLITAGLVTATPVSFPEISPEANSLCPRDAVDSSTLDLRSSSGSRTLTLNIRFVFHTAKHCNYGVLDGIKGALDGEPQSAVVSTPRIDCPEAKYGDTEAEALRDLNELLFDGHDGSGRRWLVKRRPWGVKLWDHPLFKTRFPDGYNKFDLTIGREMQNVVIEDCDVFMRNWYDQVIAAHRDALFLYGWGNRDVNFETIFFTLEAPSKITITE
ncbi:hypothetical protein FRB99_004731 [Tulasnella sp. 403]|nr:hypothetical protein FRB99_004731 [Tulasnella sp. 403]